MNKQRFPKTKTTEDLKKILAKDGLGKARAERKNFALDNDIDDLLSDYGVGIETSQDRTDRDARLEKMRKRVLEDSSNHRANLSKKSPLAFLLWLIGCILLITLLVVQYAIFNVNSLVKNPESQAKLAQVCKFLSCSLPSANLDNIRVSNIEHGVVNNETKVVASINQLENVRQLYPNLKISIYGLNGLLGEMVLQPKDYLLSEKQIEMANSKTIFMLTIPISNNEINNINIVPFY
ncbi:MAG: DUF3426 domain-containing protein [Moraxellaceae bacterium]|nr:DUF3426 domain-containing protein [Moraxellaceae bacterium]